MNKNKVKKLFKIAGVCTLLIIPTIVNAEDETIKIKNCPAANSGITVGQNKELSVDVTPEGSEVIWEWKKVEEGTTAEITLDNGKVTAVKPGNVIVTAKIKDTEVTDTCNISITRDMSDANINSLSVTNGTLDKSFNKDVTEYNVTVDSEVTSLNFDFKLSDQDANYMINGNEKLKDGSVVTFIVTAQDNKTKKTYKFNIVQNTVNLNLKTLKINGYPFNEVFDPEVLEYTASIPYEIDTISLETKAEDTNMKIVPSGLSGLKVGENTVKVTIKDENNNSRVYVITVTREEENKIEENPTSIITSSDIVNNDSNNSNTTNSNSNDTNNEFLKYAIVSLACLILFVIGGIGIYFYLKTSPKKLKKEVEKLKSAKAPTEAQKEEIENTKEL